MGDVGEGPAMDEDRHPFHRLDKVRVDGVLEQGGHGACPPMSRAKTGLRR